MSHLRPLSPHLAIYEWRITMVLSILHRVTGIFMCAGLLLLTWGLLALAAGESAWTVFAGFCGSWFGCLLLLAWTFSLLLHGCNGIRHLFWDAGAGFAKSEYLTSSWVVVIVSLALTAIVWIWAMMATGAA